MTFQQADTDGELEVQLSEVPVYQNNTDEFKDTSSRFIVEETPEKYGEGAEQDEDEKKDEFEGHLVDILAIDVNQTENMTMNRRLTESQAEDGTGAG